MQDVSGESCFSTLCASAVSAVAMHLCPFIGVYRSTSAA